MALSDFIQIQISIDSIGIARAGFGIPMIPSANATFSSRLRFYADIPGLAADWAPTSPEFLAGSAMFSQENKPEQIAIGRCVNKPTQQYTIGAAQVSNSTHYHIRARGQGVTDTTVDVLSDSTATAAEIHNGLLVALNAVVGANYTATFAPLTFTPKTFTVADQPTGKLTVTGHGLNTGDGPFQLTTTGGLPTGLSTLTNYWAIAVDANTIQLATSLANALAGTAIVLSSNGTPTNTINGNTPLSPTLPFLVTGNAPGNWFSLEILDPDGLNTSAAVTYLSNAQTHADPGIGADLIAIDSANSGWYAVYPLYNSKAYALGLAATVETMARIALVDTCDSVSVTTDDGSGDVMSSAKASSYSRTSFWYHPSPIDFLGAALMGVVLPLDPGSETWAFKPNLAGPRPVGLTATHKQNLRDKNGNTYEQQTSDIAWTWDGKTPDGEFIDTIRGLDSLRDDVTKSIATVLASNPKVPYTDDGIVLLANEFEGAFARAVSATILSNNPAPTFVVPRASSQSSADRKARKFRGLKGSGQLAGAVQDVGPISIVITE